ncbi:bifunctional heptose 7-phosphate kinase/heptose 1-phosphate adenyltransferase [Coraliomargarita sp. W4R72]
MFSNLKILVIGDIMLDHYIWGDATRISPEAPVPVVGVERDTYVPGGAANVACNLSGLGVKTALLGRYGPDDGGNRLGAMLSEQHISLLPLGCRKKSATIVKTRVIVQRQQMCRIDRELVPEQYNLSDSLSSESFTDLVMNCDAVIVSDYAKGVIDGALLEMLRNCLASISSLQARPLLVVDPKPKRHLDLSGMDLMTPNRGEALQLAGLPSEHGAAFNDEAVCTAIWNRYAPKYLVITLGAEGMLLCCEGKILGRLPTEAKEVFDVSGAGDTVVATLTAALAAGQYLDTAAKLANQAAGIVVSHLGTSPISRNQLSD